jgi:hypothetical protein
MMKIRINEGQYAYVMAQIALMNAEVAGMQAENQHRMNRGNSIAYGDAEFAEVRAHYEARIGHEAFKGMANGE